VALFVPFPMIRSPVEVTGDNALNAADAVVCPVPPLAIARVPAKVTVPDVVTGPPLVVRPVVPPLTLTLVTVPEPPLAGEETHPVPLEVSTLPFVPGEVRPVPPLAAASVPASVMVPEDVMGPPLAVRPVVPPLTLTLVTVPVLVTVFQYGAPVPLDVNTCPAVPAAVYASVEPVP